MQQPKKIDLRPLYVGDLKILTKFIGFITEQQEASKWDELIDSFESHEYEDPET